MAREHFLWPKRHDIHLQVDLQVDLLISLTLKLQHFQVDWAGIWNCLWPVDFQVDSGRFERTGGSVFSWLEADFQVFGYNQVCIEDDFQVGDCDCGKYLIRAFISWLMPSVSLGLCGLFGEMVGNVFIFIWKNPSNGRWSLSKQSSFFQNSIIVIFIWWIFAQNGPASCWNWPSASRWISFLFSSFLFHAFHQFVLCWVFHHHFFFSFHSFISLSLSLSLSLSHSIVFREFGYRRYAQLVTF